MGKGGGGKSQTSTVYQSSLPQYARPFYESLMERGQEESTRPYQTYEGRRLADMSGQTVAGLNMAQNFAQSGSPDLNNARDITNLVGSQAMDLQNYVAGGVNNTYLGPEDYATGIFNADQVGTEKFGTDARDEYMSPYMASVTEAAQREAAENAARENMLIRANQGTTGGFGGSRGAVQTQMAMSDAQKRIADIGVQGRQAAFENAQQQFERDQARGLSAQLANQKANLEALGMGEESRQFGATLGETGRQKAAELGMYGQEATEKLRQGGKQLGLQGLQLAGNMGQQMAGFQELSDQMMMDRFKAMLGVGQTREDYEQRQYDTAYEDFINQRDANRQNLQFMSSLLHGVPVSANSNVTQSVPNNNIQGAIGGMMGIEALNSLRAGNRGQTA